MFIQQYEKLVKLAEEKLNKEHEKNPINGFTHLDTYTPSLVIDGNEVWFYYDGMEPWAYGDSFEHELEITELIGEL